MRTKIKELERAALELEPDETRRAAIRERVINYTENFLNEIYQRKAFEINNNSIEDIEQDKIREEREDIDALLSLVSKSIDFPGLNPASGGHLGYIPGGGLYTSSLGDYMADISNNYAGIFFAGPGAVLLENKLIAWMAELAGYPKGTAGNLTSGGSIANLTGIVTARDAHKLKARDFHRCVAYMTAQAHHSVDKALRICGMGECVIRHVPMDEYYKMDTVALSSMISNDKKNELLPWLVIASAGSTDTGAVDPLNDIADIANQNGLWMHVDGAYGAFFLLCDGYKAIFKGIEKSDSLVMDPHKGLFLPYGTGAVLVKDAKALNKAHYYTANYMQDAIKTEQDYLSPAELSPELTKHFRGLRMWLPLKLHGLKPFKACLEEKLELARYFHREVAKIPGFVTGPDPELSVCTFRYLPSKGDANQFNRKLIDEIHKDGRVFISSTMIDGIFTLRLAALAFRTHIDTIDMLLEMLKLHSEKLKQK